MFEAPQVQLPQAPPPPPMFGSDAVKGKPKSKSMQPTFLGQSATPTNTGQKTLLGT